MQRIYIALLFALVPFLGKTQSKPSKEETIKFMNSILKQGAYADYEKRKNELLSFTGEILQYKGNSAQYAYEDIDWSSYSDFNGQAYDKKYIRVRIYFDKPFKFGSDRGSHSEKIIEWYLPLESKDKLESFKKACLRLREIWQEENNDPFAN